MAPIKKTTIKKTTLKKRPSAVVRGAAAPNSPWRMHVEKFRKAHPTMAFGEALKEASKTYHKK